MKNREIINNLNNLEAMAVREKKAIEANPDYKRMNIKVAYKIIANKKLLREMLEPYETALKELTDKYGVKMDVNGINTSRLEKQKSEAFAAELNELLNINVELEVNKANIEDFGDYTISQEDMAVLEFMVM